MALAFPPNLLLGQVAGSSKAVLVSLYYMCCLGKQEMKTRGLLMAACRTGWNSPYSGVIGSGGV